MTIERIPGEFRWWVSSESRPISHLVDLQYRPEPWNKAGPACSCESNFIHGRICPHIEGVVEFELNNIQALTAQAACA